MVGAVSIRAATGARAAPGVFAVTFPGGHDTARVSGTATADRAASTRRPERSA
jgi:hypothetical protein